jgi:hypothetical protein
MNKLTQNDFIKRIESRFGINKFDYSLLSYKDAHSNVKLVCKNCGNIENKPPTVWYKGFGCLKCQNRRPNPKQVTKEQFIERAKKIHDDIYDYSKIDYKTLYQEVEIICSKHGSFFQKPAIHLYAKSNCPECNIYKGEEQVGIWLNKNNIEYVYQHQVKIENSYHYYDFYLPKHNMLIEYNGLQHYKPITFFGGEKGFEYLKQRDKIKEKYCLDNKINLIILSYKDDIERVLNITLKII